jgi:hypothetical protein
VLIIAGDKTGDARFYERMVPRAEAIWTDYLAEQASGQHPGPADDDDGWREP